MMKNNILLLSYILLLLSACTQFFPEQPENNPKAVFEDLWTTMYESYGPFEERDVDWNALYTLHSPLVDEFTDDDSLYAVITNMLAYLDDGHVNLTAPDRGVFNANYLRRNEIDINLFNLDIIRSNYLEPDIEALEDNGYVYGKIIGENIGYIYFDYVADNFFVMDAFLNDNNNSDGIIIDLRHNQGGDFTYCFAEIGRLTNETRYVFRSRTKNGPGINDYTPWYAWSIQPEGAYFDKPIVVLTDRYTISAGERAVMAFMTLPNATILGDTTSGAHSTAIGRELANGWYYSIATQNTELFDGQSYEGKGLPPEIYHKNVQVDVDNGIDQTLQAAIDLF